MEDVPGSLPDPNLTHDIGLITASFLLSHICPPPALAIYCGHASMPPFSCVSLLSLSFPQTLAMGFMTGTISRYIPGQTTALL